MARQLRPERGSTLMESLAGIFGEDNPMEVTNTPRPAGNLQPRAEKIHAVPLVVANGWIDRPAQTAGMFTLYVDQIAPMPADGVQGITKSAIGHSRYEPYNHYRAGHWMYMGWDPIFRFANTAMDMRFQVGRPAPLTNTEQTNLPGSVRMGPYYAPFRTAQLPPRFSTEPNTIIPIGGK